MKKPTKHLIIIISLFIVLSLFFSNTVVTVGISPSASVVLSSTQETTSLFPLMSSSPPSTDPFEDNYLRDGDSSSDLLSLESVSLRGSQSYDIRDASFGLPSSETFFSIPSPTSSFDPSEDQSLVNLPIRFQIAENPPPVTSHYFAPQFSSSEHSFHGSIQGAVAGHFHPDGALRIFLGSSTTINSYSLSIFKQTSFPFGFSLEWQGNLSDTTGTQNVLPILSYDFDQDGTEEVFLFGGLFVSWDGTGYSTKWEHISSRIVSPGENAYLHDIDLDGFQELIVASYESTGIYSWDGDINNFHLDALLPTGCQYGIGIGDIDGDMVDELVTSNYSSHEIVIYGHENGFFLEEYRGFFHSLTSYSTLTVVDIDNDNSFELIAGVEMYGDVATYPLTLFEWDGFALIPQTLIVNEMPFCHYQSRVGDIDGDGLVEVIVAENGGGAAVVEQSSDGSIICQRYIGVTLGVLFRFDLFDVDGDSRLEFISSNPQGIIIKDVHDIFHYPISIDGNAALVALAELENWPGQGIESDPYLLDGLTFNNPFGNAIEIRNTDLFVNISNCQFENSGIFLSNCQNILILDNTITNSQWNSIFAFSSSYCSFDGNTIINSNDGGIVCEQSTNIFIQSNEIFDCAGAGIACLFAPDNTISYNNLYSNRHGVVLYFSDNCIVSQNQISNNEFTGMYISRSSSNTVLDNSFLNDGLYFWCSAVDQALQEEVDGNTFNGKPIIFLQNQVGGSVPAGAGQIFLIKCHGVSVENQDLSSAIIGLHAAFCTDLSIVSSAFSNNLNEGIWFYQTNSSLIFANDIFQNGDGGLGLYASHNNTVSSNSIHDNIGSDLYIVWSSENNSIVYNNIVNNEFRGLFIEEGSNGNKISWNNFIDNNGGNCQAADDGLNNIFLANHWNDLTSPDADFDGIIDSPYSIDGLSGNSDSSPYVLADGWTVLPTDIGTNVEVTEPGSGVDLIFDTVDTSGTTSVTVLETPPESPTGFEVTGINYDISTTASFTGLVEVAIPYDGTLVPGNEADLRLLHWDGQSWVDVTTWVDTINDIIYGEVSSFSIFSLMLSFDLLPPVSEITLDNYFVNSAGETYVTSSSSFTLNATDLESGVAASYYRINGGEWFTYVAPFSLSDSPDGYYILDFFSVDNIGKEEVIQSLGVHLVSVSLSSFLGEEDGTALSYFDVIFSKFKDDGYKLVATNPGQIFYFLEFQHNFPLALETASLNLMIPADFVMKGTNPIIVYSDGVDISEFCTISDSTILIPDVFSGAIIQIVVHLDYGLKGVIFSSLEDYGMKNYLFPTFLDACVTESFSGTYSSESNLFSHQKKTTAIAGFVTDAAGVPLSGVTVTIQALFGEFLEISTVTDEWGFFYFIDIDAGNYLVCVIIDQQVVDQVQIAAINKELLQVDFTIEV